MIDKPDIDFFKHRPLDKTIPIPIYFQLMEILQDYINTYDHGCPIPTENEICSIYEISRPTVRQAISALSVEGLILRQKGKGSFINKRKVSQDFLLTISSFNDEMQAKGLIPETKVLGFYERKSNPQLGGKLLLPSNADLVYLSRLRSVNHEPVVLVNTWLPAESVPGLMQKDMEKESLYHILEHCYSLKIMRTVRTLEYRSAAQYEAELLGMPVGGPIHYIETVAYSKNDKPIEFSTAFYRGDKNKFTIEVRAQ